MKAWIEGKKRVGPWKVRWRETVDGRPRKRASQAFANRSEAVAWKEAKDRALEAAKGPDRRHPSLSVDDLFTRWSNSRLAEGAIRATYAEEVRRGWEALCGKNEWAHVSDITAASVEAWRTGRTKGTQKPLRMIKSLLSWAHDTLHEPIDLAVLHLSPPPQRERAAPDLLTDEQLEAIIARADALGETFGTLVRHLSCYGCRPIDACRLIVGDWNRRTRLLTLRGTKNGSDVTHPVDEELAGRFDRLTEHRPASEPLYQNPEGGAWAISATGSATQLYDWYVTNIGNKVIAEPTQRGIYCLKDLAISTMEAAGIDDRTKALFTGHRTLGVFARYKTTNHAQATAAIARMNLRKRSAPSGAESGAIPISGGNIGGESADTPKPDIADSPDIPTNPDLRRRGQAGADET